MLTCESTTTEPMKRAFYEKLNSLRDINENFADELEECNWKNIRYLTKVMWQKCKNDR